MRLLFALFLVLLTGLSRAADNAAFNHALAAYKSGQYETALAEFKKIAEDEKQISAALCHNIGNCEYKIGQAADGEKDEQRKIAYAHYGQASIWYRRALALNPLLTEAQQNLRFLQGKIGFHWFEPEGRYAQILARIPLWQWRAACFSFIWLAVISLVWLAWFTPRRGRRWPLVTLLCLGIFFANGFGVFWWRKTEERAPFVARLVNIVSPESFARSAPAEAAGSVMPLKPGSELKPIREEGFWTYVEIPGDSDHPTRGWVRTTTVEKLWPWNPSIVE